ncbi:MAG: hypothetical protein A2283_21825 [Lentisphaerae bacterium RIFOXYA12_FULL_48_11]|nr:MAG: hypothetical protein A2283_21825 [Lentisphaerae bacterium RIFOXYA12_FULL_48_11]
MNKSVDGSDKKVQANGMLLQGPDITAGRKNLLSSIWGGRNKIVTTTLMPNGDPPSLMLWGAEEDMGEKRYTMGHSRV